jgi:uroporphyrinogen-III synthase
MKPLLVLRPQPGADATVARAEAMGLQAIAAPLFSVVPLAWAPPDPAGVDAVLMTSANAARHGGEALRMFAMLPLLAVGAVTAAAARAAGFADVTQGDRDGAALLKRASERGCRRVLHLAGRDHMDLPMPGGSIERRIVYAADAVGDLPAPARKLLTREAIVLCHSPRAAGLFGRLVDKAGLARGGIAIAALSEAVAQAAGSGWATVEVASAPKDDALLEIAARLCNQSRMAALKAEGTEDERL